MSEGHWRRAVRPLRARGDRGAGVTYRSGPGGIFRGSRRDVNVKLAALLTGNTASRAKGGREGESRRNQWRRVRIAAHRGLGFARKSGGQGEPEGITMFPMATMFIFAGLKRSFSAFEAFIISLMSSCWSFSESFEISSAPFLLGTRTSQHG